MLLSPTTGTRALSISLTHISLLSAPLRLLVVVSVVVTEVVVRAHTESTSITAATEGRWATKSRVVPGALRDQKVVSLKEAEFIVVLLLLLLLSLAGIIRRAEILDTRDLKLPWAY